MTKRTGNAYSSKFDSVDSAISQYIQKTNKRGQLDSSARLFIAMALGQTAKDSGCCLSELCFLSDMPKGRVKSALATLGSLGLVEIAPTKFLIAVKTEARFYLPSRWNKGGRVGAEKLSGPRPPSYKLNVVNRRIVVPLLRDAVKELSSGDFIKAVRAMVQASSDSSWKGYVRFARLLLHDISESVSRTRSLYGEFLPRKLDADIRLLYSSIRAIDENCERREFVLGIIDEVERRLGRQATNS